jgi:hypothetical protein
MASNKQDKTIYWIGVIKKSGKAIYIITYKGLVERMTPYDLSLIHKAAKSFNIPIICLN